MVGYKLPTADAVGYILTPLKGLLGKSLTLDRQVGVN
jgi:hypothetical protein